jgi:Flp pilus assembly protein TadG
MLTTNHTRRRNRGGRRATSAVELALILPLLVTIVLGCVDFGRFAYTYIAVTNAARAGAGFASANPVTDVTRDLWEQGVRQAVTNEMGDAFQADQITVPSPVVTTDAEGLTLVRVEVSCSFATLADWPLLPNHVVLTRAVEMRMMH